MIVLHRQSKYYIVNLGHFRFRLKIRMCSQELFNSLSDIVLLARLDRWRYNTFERQMQNYDTPQSRNAGLIPDAYSHAVFFA